MRCISDTRYHKQYTRTLNMRLVLCRSRSHFRYCLKACVSSHLIPKKLISTHFPEKEIPTQCVGIFCIYGLLLDQFSPHDPTTGYTTERSTGKEGDQFSSFLWEEDLYIGWFGVIRCCDSISCEDIFSFFLFAIIEIAVYPDFFTSIDRRQIPE